MPRLEITPERKLQAKSLWEAGRSAKAIADAVGCSPSTVHYWARKFAWSKAIIIDLEMENKEYSSIQQEDQANTDTAIQGLQGNNCANSPTIQHQNANNSTTLDNSVSQVSHVDGKSVSSDTQRLSVERAHRDTQAEVISMHKLANEALERKQKQRLSGFNKLIDNFIADKEIWQGTVDQRRKLSRSLQEVAKSIEIVTKAERAAYGLDKPGSTSVAAIIVVPTAMSIEDWQKQSQDLLGVPVGKRIG